MKKKYTYLIVIFLIVTSCAAFGRIVGNDFINFDDNAYITENNYIESGITLESFKWAFSAFVSKNWHPLTRISLMSDYSLFGANPECNHLINLLLYIGAVIFLFLFLNKTTNNIWSAAFAAALFALHPLRVESVAWAAERKDDFNKSIRLNSAYANTYNNRGSVYIKLGQYQQALNDFSEAITLSPNHANAYHNRGINYVRLNQYQLAINDFNKAISLKEDDADFYFCRGNIYLSQGNKNLGCLDAQKACQLGNCKLLELAKGKGYCR
jgi:tetratricopeptide (TPR) repeat protein